MSQSVTHRSTQRVAKPISYNLWWFEWIACVPVAGFSVVIYHTFAKMVSVDLNGQHTVSQSCSVHCRYSNHSTLMFLALSEADMCFECYKTKYYTHLHTPNLWPNLNNWMRFSLPHLQTTQRYSKQNTSLPTFQPTLIIIIVLSFWASASLVNFGNNKKKPKENRHVHEDSIHWLWFIFFFHFSFFWLCKSEFCNATDMKKNEIF